MYAGLEHRCRQSGLTIDQLEALVSTDLNNEPRAPSYRETAASPVRHAVHVLRLASRRLGVEPNDVFAEGEEDATEPSPPDAARLAAALAGGPVDRQALAIAMDWDDDRLRCAIAAAKAALTGAGLRVAESGDLIRLAPAARTLTTTQREELGWRSLRASGLSNAAGELLVALARDPKIRYLELLSPQYRLALQALTDAGLLDVIGERLILSERTATALLNEPWIAAARQLRSQAEAPGESRTH